MRVSKRALTIPSAVLLSLALVSIPEVEAQAATCPSGAICVFQDANWSGGKYVWYPPKENYDFNSPVIKFSNGVKVNDKISSFISNSDNYVTFCVDYIGAYPNNCDLYGPYQDTAQVKHNDAYSSFNS